MQEALLIQRRRLCKKFRLATKTSSSAPSFQVQAHAGGNRSSTAAAGFVSGSGRGARLLLRFRCLSEFPFFHFLSFPFF